MLFPGGFPGVEQPAVQGINRKLDADCPFGLENQQAAIAEVHHAEKTVAVKLVCHANRYIIHLVNSEFTRCSLETDTTHTKEQLVVLAHSRHFSP